MENEVVRNPKKLKKHIAMIHCSSGLNLIQRKISNVLLEYARPSMQTNETHTITVAKLCELIEYTGNNFDWIKDALHRLIETKIEWDIFNELGESEGWAASTMLSSVLVTKGKGSTCYYSYSPLIRGYLQDPSRYAEIDLVTQAKFTSLYGLALYENCIRYKNLPCTKQWEIFRFREIIGVKDKSLYPIFRDFNKRVLSKAVDEVNKFSEMTVEPQLIKQGKKVVAIQFLTTTRVKQKQIQNLPAKNNDGFDICFIETEKKDALQKMVHEFGIRKRVAEGCLKDYGVEKICKAMDYVLNTRASKKGNVDGLGAGYLIETLRNGWYEIPKSRKEVEEEKIKNIELIKEQESIKNKELEKSKQKYIQYLQKELSDIFLKLSQEDQDNLKTEFKKFLKDSSLPMSIEYHLDHYGFFDAFVIEFLGPFMKKKKEFENKILSHQQYLDKEVEDEVTSSFDKKFEIAC